MLNTFMICPSPRPHLMLLKIIFNSAPTAHCYFLFVHVQVPPPPSARSPPLCMIVTYTMALGLLKLVHFFNKHIIKLYFLSQPKWILAQVYSPSCITYAYVLHLKLYVNKLPLVPILIYFVISSWINYSQSPCVPHNHRCSITSLN